MSVDLDGNTVLVGAIMDTSTGRPAGAQGPSTTEDGAYTLTPEGIADQVPELKKLLDLRAALTALKGPLGNRPAFKKQMQKMLENDDSKAKLMAELGLDKKDGGE